jgi:DNA-binding transcriptional MerR regulator
MMADMGTREMADRAGVNTQTLHYYERRGLPAEPPRAIGAGAALTAVPWS